MLSSQKADQAQHKDPAALLNSGIADLNLDQLSNLYSTREQELSNLRDVQSQFRGKLEAAISGLIEQEYPGLAEDNDKIVSARRVAVYAISDTVNLVVSTDHVSAIHGKYYEGLKAISSRLTKSQGDAFEQLHSDLFPDRNLSKQEVIISVLSAISRIKYRGNEITLTSLRSALA
jgi:hypothetical protein